MGRKYSATFTAAFTAAGDIIQVASASTKVTRIAEIHVEQHTDYGDAQAEGFELALVRGTAGSGGSTVTARPLSPSDTAFAGTVLSKNTTPIGSTTVVVEGGMNIQAGWHWTPAPGWEWEIAPSAAMALQLVNASATANPADSVTMEVTLLLEELG